MKNLRERMSCYLIASISYYSTVRLVSTRVVVARTRAGCRLSAAGLTGMAATGPRREAQAVSNEKPQLATERHRLAKIGDERAG